MRTHPKMKVCVCTGTRAEYGLLRPVMRRIARSRKLTLQVAAAGMHLAREFGRTIDNILADGFRVDARVPMLPGNDTPAAMAESVGQGVIGFTKAFQRLKSDVVVVLGDRTECFAAAVAATLSGRILAHIHGGDRSQWTFDEPMRHAITKLAHVHFAATRESARRIVRLGERKDRVFVVGAPGLDELNIPRLPSPSATKRKHGFPPRGPLILAVQHSISVKSWSAAAEITETLEALRKLSLPTVLIYPDSDAGGRAIIRVIKEYEGRKAFTRAGARWLKTYKSLPRDEYLAVMKAADVMAGNSSSGIIEAASFGLPVVNIGPRQKGRERSGNTIDVPASREMIFRALKTIFSDLKTRKRLSIGKNVYGDGRASEKIVRVLERLDPWSDIRAKQITY